MEGIDDIPTKFLGGTWCMTQWTHQYNKKKPDVETVLNTTHHFDHKKKKVISSTKCNKSILRNSRRKARKYSRL